MSTSPLSLQAVGLAAGAALALGAIAFTPAAPAAPPMFHVQVLPLPFFQPGAVPTCLSAEGVVAGHFTDDPWSPTAQPATVTPNRTQILTKPFDSLNFALGIGHPDLVVGTSASAPVAWVKGNPQVLSPAAGLVNGAAHGATRQGRICGTLYNDLIGTQLPVVWPSATGTGAQLPIGAASQGAAFAINEAGLIAGLLMGGSIVNFEAARWDDPLLPPTLLGRLPGAMNSEVVAISGRGDCAGRSSFPDFSTEAILHIRRSNSLLGLGKLGGNYSSAFGVNASRQVVGTSSTASGEPHGFLWQEGTMHDLNNLIQSTSEPILYVESAVAINETGEIAALVRTAGSSGSVMRMAILKP